MKNSEKAASTNGKRVLIVDDDRFITRVLKIKFEQGGFQVFTAHNGANALEQVNKHHPQVVITDLNMPVMDGWELCSKINQVQNAKPDIIVTTSLIERKEREKIKEFPNAKLIDKPVSPKEIFRLVQDCFQHSAQKGENY